MANKYPASFMRAILRSLNSKRQFPARFQHASLGSTRNRRHWVGSDFDRSYRRVGTKDTPPVGSCGAGSRGDSRLLCTRTSRSVLVSAKASVFLDALRILQPFTNMAGEGTQEIDEGLLFVDREICRTNLRIDIRVLPAAFGIELDHVLECGKTTVVHIGGGAGNFPQRRRFERATLFLVAGNSEAALIGKRTIPPGDARVMEPFVGKAWPGVARAAT